MRVTRRSVVWRCGKSGHSHTCSHSVSCVRTTQPSSLVIIIVCDCKFMLAARRPLPPSTSPSDLLRRCSMCLFLAMFFCVSRPSLVGSIQECSGQRGSSYSTWHVLYCPAVNSNDVRCFCEERFGIALNVHSVCSELFWFCWCDSWYRFACAAGLLILDVKYHTLNVCLCMSSCSALALSSFLTHTGGMASSAFALSYFFKLTNTHRFLFEFAR